MKRAPFRFRPLRSRDNNKGRGGKKGKFKRSGKMVLEKRRRANCGRLAFARKTKIVHISTAGRSSAAAVPDVLQIDKDEQDE